VGERLGKFSFGIKIKNDMFVRSVLSVDAQNGILHFACDLSFGEELHLLKQEGLVERTQGDFQPLYPRQAAAVGGLLNDCILRRLNNSSALPAAMFMVISRWPVSPRLASCWGSISTRPRPRCFSTRPGRLPG
jgi:hypothetical protein